MERLSCVFSDKSGGREGVILFPRTATSMGRNNFPAQVEGRNCQGHLPGFKMEKGKFWNLFPILASLT